MTNESLIMMAKEEESQRYSNSSSGGGTNGRSSRKLKQKKVPQRGLGVEQLEKMIRMEEQQKKNLALQAPTIFSPNSILSPTSNSSSSCLAVHHQSTNFRPAVSHVLPLVSRAEIPSTNSTFRPPLYTSALTRSNSVPMYTSNNVGGCEMVWHQQPMYTSSSGQGSWPTSGEYNHIEVGKLDHHGSVFRANGNLPYQCNTTIWPVSGVMQRSENFQQPCPSSMVS